MTEYVNNMFQYHEIDDSFCKSDFNEFNDVQRMNLDESYQNLGEILNSNINFDSDPLLFEINQQNSLTWSPSYSCYKTQDVIRPLNEAQGMMEGNQQHLSDSTSFYQTQMSTQAQNQQLEFEPFKNIFYHFKMEQKLQERDVFIQFQTKWIEYRGELFKRFQFIENSQFSHDQYFYKYYNTQEIKDLIRTEQNQRKKNQLMFQSLSKQRKKRKKEIIYTDLQLGIIKYESLQKYLKPQNRPQFKFQDKRCCYNSLIQFFITQIIIPQIQQRGEWKLKVFLEELFPGVKITSRKDINKQKGKIKFNKQILKKSLEYIQLIDQKKIANKIMNPSKKSKLAQLKRLYYLCFIPRLKEIKQLKSCEFNLNQFQFSQQRPTMKRAKQLRQKYSC